VYTSKLKNPQGTLLFPGAGVRLFFLPAIVTVALYFKKKRALATGIDVAGSGAVGFIFAARLYLLIQQST